jgi:hypothetical protein
MGNLTVAGVVLVLVGLWLIIRPPTFAHQENAFKLGDFQASFEERRPLPGWVGGTVLGGGLALVIIGLLKRS